MLKTMKNLIISPLNVLFCLFLTLFTLGCSTKQQPKDFATQQPQFELEKFFEGKVKGWGAFFDRNGNQKSRFTFDVLGEFSGDILTLSELISYANGDKETRVWKMKKLANGNWEGLTADVPGVAIGEGAGNALRWNYYLNLKVDGAVYKVWFDDWMYLQEGNVLMNRAAASKFGVDLGEAFMFFIPEKQLVQ